MLKGDSTQLLVLLKANSAQILVYVKFLIVVKAHFTQILLHVKLLVHLKDYSPQIADWLHAAALTERGVCVLKGHSTELLVLLKAYSAQILICQTLHSIKGLFHSNTTSCQFPDDFKGLFHSNTTCIFFIGYLLQYRQTGKEIVLCLYVGLLT